MKRTMRNWTNNTGEVVFKSRDSFTRTGAQAIKQYAYDIAYTGDISHMRMGRFSVVVFKNRDVLCAMMYDDNDRSHDVARDSKYFEMSRRDRLSQINIVKQALRNTHPDYVELSRDMNDEIERLS